MIYFIQENSNGPIKIGYTEGTPEKRLSELQTGCPNKLKLLATMQGDKRDESLLHTLFTKYRLNSEWFSPNSELLLFINTHAKYEYSEFLIRAQLSKIKPKLEESFINQTRISLYHTLKEIERAIIIETLKLTEGKQSTAANLLGMGRSGLNQKISKYKIVIKDILHHN